MLFGKKPGFIVFMTWIAEFTAGETYRGQELLVEPPLQAVVWEVLEGLLEADGVLVQVVELELPEPGQLDRAHMRVLEALLLAREQLAHELHADVLVRGQVELP
ncbi:MAG: hypothetical protein GY700_12480 [Propionibacteriaceae bacterium]|nr:hypothetical protein [Propionibacteriaceae bacterium]